VPSAECRLHRGGIVCSLHFPGQDDGPVTSEESFEFFVSFGVNQALDFPAVDEAVFEEFADVVEVFGSACCEFAEGEILFL
jgi:hypothetical protein